ncbi:hypothetical protein Q0601_23775, partial [Paracoccus onubensis]|uniref:hypothetical protein n=1 Tax=Paracoccus onubensis TaxID=1675788 RepID=UPI002731A2D0
KVHQLLASAGAATARVAAQIFDFMSTISGKLIDLIRALLRNRTGKGEGAVGEEIEIKRPAATRKTLPEGVTIGRNANQEYHAWRHVEDELGMSREPVRDAIIDDLPSISELSDGLNVRQVTVDGVKLQYNVYKLPDGTVNIGRINAAD